MLNDSKILERSDEFAPNAHEWPGDLSRRQFLEVMGASLALAGLGACNRPPEKTIVPYVSAPDRALLDATVYYATAMPWEGYGRGLLALSNSGRPTKLEGNPAHPDSLGATDILMQAAVLSLYDPDRSRAPHHDTGTTSWDAFEDAWLEIHRALTAARGRGLAILTEPTTSPTLRRGLHHLLDRFPDARWYQHTPLARYDRDQVQEDFDFEHADVILSLDADFLGSHPSSLRYVRSFAQRRQVKQGRIDANRLYVFEPGLSITGAMADHRIPASPRRIRQLLTALAALLDGKESGVPLTREESRILTALAADLPRRAPHIVCLAGAHVEAEVHTWAVALNARLGAEGVTLRRLPAVRSDGDPRCAGDLAVLTAAMTRGEVETLVFIDTNPAYDAPADLRFSTAMTRVPRRIHLGAYRDETAELCQWHVPQSHFLECWGDVRAFDGTASIMQPLIAPLYLSRSAAEFVFFLAEPPGRSDYDLVRDTWRQSAPSPSDFDARWQRWLNQGLIDGTSHAPLPSPNPPPDAFPNLAAAPEAEARSTAESVTVIIQPDSTVRDGRWANHGWLQELPKPMTKLVWDNAALVSPALAARQGWQNGDVVTLRVGHAAVDAPIWIAPGTAPDCVVVHLGYGRTRAGTIGTGLGFAAYRLRAHHRLWAAPVSEVRATGARVGLVSTHAHFSMEGRDLVRTASANAPLRRATRATEPPTLYPEWNYNGYRWGMLIDLGACVGCSACVVACQAENNSPVVGRDQVSRGREMHWIRIDQYFVGAEENPTVLHQPVPCMQCENAPCELVCPVAATVHSSEGLNDMIYNRCIGTRYCSNNCPYKVRRFNFLDYRDPKDSPVYLQKNPEVTVRARGVMEKCTYCVQRINAARISAERENRRIPDGEVRTACQQACPAEAIAFGDLNDPKSKVRARKAEPTHYVLLEALNTQPRTTYLARITNQSDAAGLVQTEAKS